MRVHFRSALCNVTLLTRIDKTSLGKSHTAVSSEAWAKLRIWASVAGGGRLLLSGGVAHASLETAI